MLQDTEEMIALRIVSGRYSRGFVREIDDHYENRTLHVHMILDEIAALEGVAAAKPCACRKSNPEDGYAYRKSSPGILVMQSTQDRTAQHASRCLGGT
jgi:hypothetical protein